MTTNDSHASRAATVRALIVAGALIGVAIALRLLSPAYLSPEFATRTMGVLLGGLVVAYSNRAPKALGPLLQRRDPAEEQAMRRFAGWSLVLGGAAYAVAWIAAPLAHANLISASLLATALLLVVVRHAWGRSRSTRAH
jgi:hypothetical protein